MVAGGRQVHVPVKDIAHDDEEAVSSKAPWKPEDIEWWLGGPSGPVMQAPLPGPVSRLLCALAAGTSEPVRGGVCSGPVCRQEVWG